MEWNRIECLCILIECLFEIMKLEKGVISKHKRMIH